MRKLLRLAAFLTIAAPLAHSQPALERHDLFVTSDPGIRIFLREVSTPHPSGTPILLIHGTRVPGLGSFDLPVPNGSLAADLARRGLDVYIIDIRGYGRSTRPPEMDLPPDGQPALVHSNDAARDIDAAVDEIVRRRHTPQVALFGWATGAQWASYYATIYPAKVRALILLNGLYRGASPQPLIGHGSSSEDPAHPGQFNRRSCGSYRLSTAASTLQPWDTNIPGEDKSTWRDPAVAQAYVDAAMASDPTSQSRTPPSFRSPCGPYEDTFYLATGRQLWDASLITAPTLVIASEHDFWSRPEDREHLESDIVHSPRVQILVIPNATHYVHLDRPEHGRDILLHAVESFLAVP